MIGAIATFITLETFSEKLYKVYNGVYYYFYPEKNLEEEINELKKLHEKDKKKIEELESQIN